MKEHFYNHDTPQKMLTDNGKSYCNSLIHDYLHKEGITHIKTSPYNPCSNGISERINQTILSILRIYRKNLNIEDILKIINLRLNRLVIIQ